MASKRYLPIALAVLVVSSMVGYYRLVWSRRAGAER